MMKRIIYLVCILTVSVLPLAVFAGEIDSPIPPEPGSSMYTL